MSEDFIQTKYNRPNSECPGKRGIHNVGISLPQSDRMPGCELVPSPIFTQGKTSLDTTKKTESTTSTMTKGRASPSLTLSMERASPNFTLTKEKVSPNLTSNKSRAWPGRSINKGEGSLNLKLIKGRASPSLGINKSSNSLTRGKASPKPNVIRRSLSPTKQAMGALGRPPSAQITPSGSTTFDDSRQIINSRSSAMDIKSFDRTDTFNSQSSATEESSTMTDSAYLINDIDYPRKSYDCDSITAGTLSSDELFATKSCVKINEKDLGAIETSVKQPENESRLIPISRAVNTVSAVQESLFEMFKETRDILMGYQSVLREKSVADFTIQCSDFSNTFSSLSSAYQACEDVIGNISDQLKDMRELTGEICDLLSQSTEREDLKAWVGLEESNQDAREHHYYNHHHHYLHH
ncbi:hypothetical protein PoB_000725100 [Plakobranchus ocellatus]|uniref:Uncharacterized protein n=1 Tax=Plakobranchus ocellatus TaxID=259542 RepID=A0AAV3YC34_9GAST|nr:hypothetical protein PoB_000725100 [Plakobranchus ocellatus]